MKKRTRWASLAMGIALTGLATAVRADAPESCRTARTPEQRLSACSDVIAGSYSTEEKAVAYRNRGRTRVDAGALDMALTDLSEAIKLNPTDHQAYTYRALVRVGRKDLDGAIADYDQVIALRPASSIGYNGRGHALLVQGKAREAIADFSEAIRLSPKSESAHSNRGLAWSKLGNLDNAIEDYTVAVNLNPIYGLAYANRGAAHEAKGNKAAAIEDYRRALLVDASTVSAKEGLTRLGAAGTLAAESQRRIGEGQALVELHCKGCHAVGASGVSANPKAPEFRSLHTRHPMLTLREPLTRGIAAPHDEMPKFQLTDAQVDTIIAYINSLGGQP